jgi:membrane-associated protein
MIFIYRLIDFILHIDVHLAEIVQHYQAWTYGILFLIVFCETGLVVTPFLPGDSLLFAAGALAASTGSLDVHLLFLLLFAAAVLGDTLNYSIGHRLGAGIFTEGSRFLKPEYLERTNRFFEKYGGKTIVLARFIPIVRTFAPFVAGMGKMTYRHFIAYNVAGGALWIALFLYGGYFFGNLPMVQKNFGLVVIAIILLSVLPAVVEVVRSRMTHTRRGSAD